jgi:hypothetical protein
VHRKQRRREKGHEKGRKEGRKEGTLSKSLIEDFTLFQFPDASQITFSKIWKDWLKVGWYRVSSIVSSIWILLPRKDHRVSILGFASQRSFTVIQLCPCTMKAAIDNT